MGFAGLGGNMVFSGSAFAQLHSLSLIFPPARATCGSLYTCPMALTLTQSFGVVLGCAMNGGTGVNGPVLLRCDESGYYVGVLSDHPITRKATANGEIVSDGGDANAAAASWDQARTLSPEAPHPA